MSVTRALLRKVNPEHRKNNAMVSASTFFPYIRLLYQHQTNYRVVVPQQFLTNDSILRDLSTKRVVIGYNPIEGVYYSDLTLKEFAVFHAALMNLDEKAIAALAYAQTPVQMRADKHVRDYSIQYIRKQLTTYYLYDHDFYLRESKMIALEDKQRNVDAYAESKLVASFSSPKVLVEEEKSLNHLCKKLLELNSGIFFGAGHNDQKAYEALMALFPTLYASGVRVLYLEITANLQAVIDYFYLNGDEHHFEQSYQKNCGGTTDDESLALLLTLIKAAYQNHIVVKAVDCYSNDRFFDAISNQTASQEILQQRVNIGNNTIQRNIQFYQQDSNADAKYVVLSGAAHVHVANTHGFQLPALMLSSSRDYLNKEFSKLFDYVIWCFDYIRILRPTERGLSLPVALRYTARFWAYEKNDPANLIESLLESSGDLTFPSLADSRVSLFNRASKTSNVIESHLKARNT